MQTNSTHHSKQNVEFLTTLNYCKNAALASISQGQLYLLGKRYTLWERRS